MNTIAFPEAATQGVSRSDTLRQALFHGYKLTLDNPQYLRTLEAIAGTLLAEDREPQDLTVAALGLSGAVCVRIVAKEAGVAAGLQEAQWLAARAGAQA